MNMQFFYFYLYQILTAFSKLKNMSEVVLLLPNTDAFNRLKMRSEVTHDNAYILLEFRTVLAVGYLFLLYFIR